MHKDGSAFVGLDTSKLKISVALAEEGRQGEIRFFGDIENTPGAVRNLVTKLTGKYHKLQFCYEAGPTGYGLHRQLTDLGQDCVVIAPSLIPKRPGERVKTNRRDAVSLARLHRAGELTAIWVPDAEHEAVRDLVRAREAAMLELREKRQHLQSFLLRRTLAIEPHLFSSCPISCSSRISPIHRGYRSAARAADRPGSRGRVILVHVACS